MAFNERGGIASAYINGALIEVAASISYKMGGNTRTPKLSSNGVAGTTSKIAAPEVTLTAIDGPAISVLALKAIQGGTLQLVMNNGKQILLLNATQVDDPEVKVESGDIDTLKFTGSAIQELVAAA